MKQVHIEGLTRCVPDASGLKELGVKTEMYIRTYCQGTVDPGCDWIMGTFQAAAEKLASVFEDFLPVLQEYFLKLGG